VGLLLVVTTPPQQNVLGLAAWLDERPGITTVVMAQENVLRPAAFIRHPVVWHKGGEAVDSAAGGGLDCSAVIVSLSGFEAAKRLAESTRYRQVARFSPGLLEAGVVWLNPRHNARRGPIVVFAAEGC
jgi:hypothetical protein